MSEKKVDLNYTRTILRLSSGAKLVFVFLCTAYVYVYSVGTQALIREHIRARPLPLGRINLILY